MEQGAGKESKAADGVGSGQERCTVMSVECIQYPGMLLRLYSAPGVWCT